MDATAALLDPDHGSLPVIAASTSRAMGFPADKCLVRLDVTFQHFEAIRLFHQFADLMPDAPRSLVRHAERTLHLFAAYTRGG